MRRGLWFAAGAGAGVYAMVRARRLAEAFTVEGIKDRLGALEVGVRLFREEVAQGQAEKETELRERLGLMPSGRPQLTAKRGYETVAQTDVGRPAQPAEEEGTD